MVLVRPLIFIPISPLNTEHLGLHKGSVLTSTTSPGPNPTHGSRSHSGTGTIQLCPGGVRGPRSCPGSWDTLMARERWVPRIPEHRSLQHGHGHAARMEPQQPRLVFDAESTSLV